MYAVHLDPDPEQYVQSIAVMEFLRVKARARDPMLIVAPLTTLGHWRREIETWTHMNCICYMGGKDDRVVRQSLSLSLVNSKCNSPLLG